jgi:hypothetical protein
LLVDCVINAASSLPRKELCAAQKSDAHPLQKYTSHFSESMLL